jgi:hypothetical protein
MGHVLTSGEPRELSNQPLNPNTPRIIIIVVLVVVVILGSLTAVWLILNPRGPTFAFTKTDQFNVVEVVFGGTSSDATNYINMTIQNTGSSPWTLTNTAQVNSVTGLKVSSTYGLTCDYGSSITVKIANVNWITGNVYSMKLLLTDGNIIYYMANAKPGGHSPDPNPNPNNVPSVPSPSPPSPIAMFVTDNPLIAASLSALAEIAVGLGVLVYIRKHVNYASDDMIGLTVCVIFLAALTFCLVYEYLTPPLTFSLHLGF